MTKSYDMDGYSCFTIILGFVLSIFSGSKAFAFIIAEPLKTLFSALATALLALVIKYLVEPLFLSLQKKIYKGKIYKKEGEL